MKAVVMSAAGDPDVLQMQDIPTPSIQTETDVLVRLKAAGINPIDTKLRQRGTFYPDRMPAVLGCDGAGVVEAVGAMVREWQVGDEVYFCRGGLGEMGNYAEYTVVDARYIAHKPKSLSFVEAAAVPLVLITAWEALFDRARLTSGQTVLIQAGAGGVGHVAIQLAKSAGARIAATVSSEQKAEFVTSLGCDRPIHYRKIDVVSEIQRWTDGTGVDVGFDTVGGATLSQTIACTRTYGDVVTILAAAADTDWKTVRDRNQRVSFELMLTPQLQALATAERHQAEILQQCAPRFDRGELKIHVQQVFPLSEAAAAHRLLEAGGLTGKLVLAID
ncbi:zinc-dependent alcohol dehydrogenase family protein [Microcoleus sp. FACHB-1515]|uniref:zinc-binding dehydrogenase n=1 Tax=Leptolyngbya sp. FACHB-1515 TaxID=2933931 RepID=UPI001684F649|nr:zinc-dependent alcohol dehydrogenase family protein [Microcoleus sp. FACHB-1515]